MRSQSVGPTPISLSCNAVTVGHPSSSTFSTDSALHLFIFITIHYISLHFSGLLFVKIAEFFKNSWLVGGLALRVQKIRQKNMRESGQKMAKFEPTLRVRSLAGNATGLNAQAEVVFDN